MTSITGILKASGRLIFDPKFQEIATETLKESKKLHGYSKLGKQIGDAFIKANKETKGVSFWNSLKTSATSLPKDISTSWKGASGFFAKSKGVFKQLGKRMPLIGAIMTVGFELPNIISAFKDKGLVGGLLETAKSGSRLVGFMGGMAIGQALIPIPVVGGIIGGMIGDWLVSKIVGKSHSEQKAEAEAKQQNGIAEATQTSETQTSQQATPTTPATQTGQIAQNSRFPQVVMPKPTLTPQQLMTMQQQLYGNKGAMSNDFMANMSGMNTNPMQKLNYTC